MKKILIILSMVLLAGSVAVAEQARASMGASQNRVKLVRKYLEKKIERSATANYQFLEAVRKGDLETVNNVSDLKQILAKDKFGNNCFHLAPNAATLQALAASVRRAAPEQVEQTLSLLRNERNEMGETPLMAHINAGRTETFRLLYQNSELQTAIQAVGRASLGGQFDSVAQPVREKAIAVSRDNSGRTVAQAAQAMVNSNIGGEGMKKVVSRFQEIAPYLF